MHTRTVLTAGMTAAALTLAACAPPPPPGPPPQISAVTYRPITAQFTVADCTANPGGSPEWQTQRGGTRILVCRIVP